MNKYVIPELESRIKTLKAVLSDKDWGKHQSDGSDKSYRFYVKEELTEFEEAIKILKKHKP